MGKKKRYFWLRLQHNFFQQREIKKLRQIAGGDTYVLIYLKMQLLSLQDAGSLYFEGYEDTFVSELALQLDEAVENVEVTFDFLTRHGLIEVVSEEEFVLPETVKNIGSECDSAERVRKHRDKKALQCNTDVTLSNTSVTSSNAHVTSCNTDIEKEIEIDKDLESETEFISFWNAYPRKLDKERTYQEWLTITTSGFKKDDLIQSAINYASTVVGSLPQYIKHPKNFLADKSFVDYLPSIFTPEQSNVVPIARTSNKFNQHQQRDYSAKDYQTIEKALLQKQL